MAAIEPTKKGHVDRNGQRIYYESYGRGPPLTLVMGIGYDATLWTLHQVPAFAQRHQVILLDNRDVGRSGPASRPYRIEDMADDVAAVLDQLRVPSSAVLGASMGGMIAMEFALKHAGRLDQLVLVNTGASAARDATNPIAEWAWLKAHDKEGKVFLRNQVAWLFSHEFRQNREGVQQILDMLAGHPFPVSAEAYARQAEAYVQHDCLDRLPRIHAPTLVISGEQDRLTPAVEGKQVADRIPGARYHLFRGPGSAHISIVERAEEFNQTVLSFLEETAKGRA